MSRLPSLVVLLAAALAAALPATAAAAEGKLRATIAQATPTPGSGEELSEDPGLPNSGETEGDGEDGTGEEATGGDETRDAELPNTGAEPLLLALMGLGLVGTGLGIRRRIGHAGPRA